MVCYCDEPYNKFVASVFRDCITGTTQTVSYIFGWISLCCWLTFYYPQLRINFLLQRSEAMSLVFLLCNLGGDFLFFVSCFMLNQQFTQKVMSTVFFCIDIIINVQSAYFRKCKTQRSAPKSTKFKLSEILVYILIGAVVASNVIWKGLFGEYQLIHNKQDYGMCPFPTQLSSKSARYIVGSIAAYITIPLYVSSTPGQIVKNFKRKSVNGLSIGMFMITITANSTQIIQYVTYSQEKAYLVQQIPYLIGCSLPIIFESTVFVQYIIYSKLNKQLELTNQANKELVVCAESNKEPETLQQITV
ncbi:Seven_transmembrane protein 1 [Hexamita inflata]|uniref:Seven transmembrane protein 1 n=1 Tax=Hexamita inflata TaxID=28002 RepID=A0AA86Q338_9EUKA|nr:Seven transmembrane protein 1 [Hexamita inflata]